jgi:hypothetical protein
LKGILDNPDAQYISVIPAPPLFEKGGEGDYYYKCTQAVGDRCVRFSLCTGGLTDSTPLAGLEFKGESNGNAEDKLATGYPTSNGTFFCVFNP